MADEPLAVVEQVTKRFGTDGPPAIDQLNMRVEPGQVTGLVGPDGAGKTTLLRLMAGLLVPSEGKIFVCGSDTARDLTPVRRVLSYMPQRFGLYEDLTVQENLDLYADLRGVIGDSRRQAFERLLSFTALAPFTRSTGRQALGRYEAEVGPRLLADSRAASPVAR